MEDHGGSSFSGMVAMRKRRSISSRRPRQDSNFVVEDRDLSSSSSPSSGNGSKLSMDDNICHDSGFKRREFHLNSSITKVASTSRADNIGLSKKARKEERKFGDLDGLYRASNSKIGLSGTGEPGRNGSEVKRCSEGVLSPANWKSKSKDNLEMNLPYVDNSIGKNVDNYSMDTSLGGSAENKVRKVKLKVGGITRTIHAKSNLEGKKGVDSSTKTSRSSEIQKHPLNLSENSGDEHLVTEKKSSWKDIRGGHSSGMKEGSSSRVNDHGGSSSQQRDKSYISQPSEPTRKSKRVPKKRVLDGEFDDVEEELKHAFDKQKTSKITKSYDPQFENGVSGDSGKNKFLKASKSRKGGYDVDNDYVSRSVNDTRKRSRTGREMDDVDYAEEEDPGSDAVSEGQKKKQKDYVEVSNDSRVEPLTTRQRALQSTKDGGSGSSLIEFPNGLPPARSRKKKEKLSEVELQAKKAEAAQRRKMQVEKANRELQAATISKILGQDPEKKKREEEKLKELDGKAEGKSAIPAPMPNTVRWAMGPSGTVITFGEGVDLPSIFGHNPCSYPPPRERCAGLLCINPYKYRDSVSNLPLCSLQCYRAVQGKPF